LESGRGDLEEQANPVEDQLHKLLVARGAAHDVVDQLVDVDVHAVKLADRWGSDGIECRGEA
jgi:hypothetical protein